ncbi:MAG: nitrate- and nitrite sensing domain-containing protein [Oligoflexia bacterium]|nr:nitrate- and nitrite sensing domain-containing protein [Oligoflexia bacterium]
MLKIQHKIALFILLPLLILVLFGIYSIYIKISDLRTADFMSQNVLILTESASLVTSMQKERGLSSIYLNNSDHSIQEVEKQRVESDKLLAVLKEGFSSIKDKRALHLTEVGEVEKELKTIRVAINERKIAPLESLKKYTEMIKILMKFANDLLREKTSFGLGKQMTNILILTEAQENLALLRGTLSGILAKDAAMEKAQVQKLITLHTGILNNAYSPALILSEAGMTQLRAIFEMPEWKTTQEIFELALSKSAEGAYATNPQEFFAKATSVIGAMIQLSESEKEAILVQIETIKKDAVSSTWIVSILLSGLFLALGVLIVFFLKDLNKLSKILLDANETVLAMANELSLKNQDLFQRTQEQSSSLQSTASAIEEITSTIKQSLDGSVTSGKLSKEAVDLAEIGKKESAESLDAMAEISSSSNKISEIVALVEEIAFQTNILAINAAIEAAKASEHGKGFAVVAIEVRDLAQRSSLAAKEINTLVHSTQEKVSHGENLVKSNNERLSEIVQKINQVAENVDTIVHAGKEQCLAIEDINKAVSDIEQVTQQNTSMVSDLASSGKQMTEKADNANNTIKRHFG